MRLGQVLCDSELSLKRVSTKVLNDYSLAETVTDILIILLNRRTAALNLFLYSKKRMLITPSMRLSSNRS